MLPLGAHATVQLVCESMRRNLLILLCKTRLQCQIQFTAAECLDEDLFDSLTEGRSLAVRGRLKGFGHPCCDIQGRMHFFDLRLGDVHRYLHAAFPAPFLDIEDASPMVLIPADPVRAKKKGDAKRRIVGRG